MMGLFLALGFGLTMGMLYKAYERDRNCTEYGASTGQQTEYVPRVGCMVKKGELWMIKR